MNIAIDTNCRHVTLAGSTRYLNGLLSGFQAIPNVTFHEIAWEVDNLTYQQPLRGLKTLYRELLWGPLIGPRKVQQTHPDVFHSPAGCLIPCPKNIPYVTTLLDCSMLRYPERYRTWQRLRSRSRFQKHHDADRIVTISDFTANEAMSLLGISSKKLTTTLLGCDFHANSLEKCPSAFTVPNEFFLFVGSLEPGKNLELLRQVYLLAASRGQTLPPLIVVGARWHGVAQEGTWPESWIGAGRIPDEQLIYLYRRALAHVFPSKYEGFGFTPLEAMTLGCPVICSHVASIPEVVEDAALYAELTPDSYLTAILQLLENSELRAELIQKGLLQSTKFSWEKCAKETLEIYNMVITPREP